MQRGCYQHWCGWRPLPAVRTRISERSVQFDRFWDAAALGRRDPLPLRPPAPPARSLLGCPRSRPSPPSPMLCSTSRSGGPPRVKGGRRVALSPFRESLVRVQTSSDFKSGIFFAFLLRSYNSSHICMDEVIHNFFTQLVWDSIHILRLGGFFLMMRILLDTSSVFHAKLKGSGF